MNILKTARQFQRLLCSKYKQKSLLLGQYSTSRRSYANDEHRAFPVKFSTSQARAHNPMDTFISSKQRQQSPLQPIMVMGSLAVLFIYMAFFREANSLDKMFERPLDEIVPNVKEMTLKNQIQKYQSMGLDTRELQAALDKEKDKRFGKL